MPDWLFDRTTIIALAVAGGVFSMLASWSKTMGWVSTQQLHWLTRAAYFLMIASMVLFVLAGFFASNGKLV